MEGGGDQDVQKVLSVHMCEMRWNRESVVVDKLINMRLVKMRCHLIDFQMGILAAPAQHGPLCGCDLCGGYK